MNKVGIIGYGYVGGATGEGFATSKENKVFWFDKYKESPNTFDEVVKESDLIFICVPTPMFRDYSGQDFSIVEEVIEQMAPVVEGTEKIVIVKSTAEPGTTAKFAKKYSKINFAMNPEFLTQAHAKADFMNPARTVIGCSKKEVGERMVELYKTILPKDQKYFVVGLTEAEIIKYMSNLVLASKVLVANEFFMLSEHVGANYDEIYPAVQADPRIGSHLRVPSEGDLGFGGACFPKDMLGILAFAKRNNIDMSALNAIWEKNLKIRKNKEWEHMDNAFGMGASKK